MKTLYSLILATSVFGCRTADSSIASKESPKATGVVAEDPAKDIKDPTRVFFSSALDCEVFDAFQEKRAVFKTKRGTTCQVNLLVKKSLGGANEYGSVEFWVKRPNTHLVDVISLKYMLKNNTQYFFSKGSFPEGKSGELTAIVTNNGGLKIQGSGNRPEFTLQLSAEGLIPVLTDDEPDAVTAPAK